MTPEATVQDEAANNSVDSSGDSRADAVLELAVVLGLVEVTA
jgi:hypothetical protein